MADHTINNQELIDNIHMLTEMMGEEEKGQREASQSQDEISCLTECSYALSDIHELKENGELTLRALLYATLYCTIL